MTEKITIIKDPRKRKPWVCRWFGLPDLETGKQRRYSKAFLTRREAEKHRSALMSDFEQGSPRDPAKDITFYEFTQDWFATAKTDLRTESIKLYEDAINRMVAYFGKKILLKSISPRLAAKFVAEQKRIRGEGDLSDWTRHRFARVGRTMFNGAVEWDLVAKNPFKGAGPSRKKLTIRDWYYLSPEEFAAILAVAPIRHRVVYVLAYCCGLRLSEALNCTWHENIIMNDDWPRVKVKDRQEANGIPPFLVKDYETREIEMPQICVEVLENLATYNEITDDTPFVCLDQRQFETLQARWERCKASGKPWRYVDTQNNTLREFKKEYKRAGIKPNGLLTIHTLRKCAILNWARVNSNPEVTRVLAGHASLTTTMKYYSKIDDRQRRESVAGLNRLLKKSDAKLTPEA